MIKVFCDCSLTPESELYDIELGYRASFDLYHLDGVMFSEEF